MLAWAFIAFMGWYTFITGIYQYTFGYRNPDELGVYPFALCFIMFLILIKPFNNKININAIANGFRERRIERLSIFLACFLMCILLFQLALTIQTFSIDIIDNYGDMYEDRASGIQLSYGSFWIDYVYSKSIAVSRIILPIVYTLMFMSIVGSRKGRGLKITMVVIITIEIILTKLLSANRGGVFFSVMTLTFYIATFYKLFSTKIKRSIWIIFGSGVVILALLMSVVSVSRFKGDNKESQTQNMRYFGEPFPNLGYNIWDKNIQHPYGRRFFPALSETLGFSEHKEFEGRKSLHSYWERYVGIPMLNFKTIFGDLFIEFGVFGAFVFLLFCFYIISYLLKHNKGIVAQVTFLSMWYDVVIYGIFGNHMQGFWFADIFYTLVFLFVLEYFVFSKDNYTSKLCWNWKS